MLLKDKVALITGGDRGIGRGIALEFAKAGADIAFCYHTRADAAEATRKEIEALGRRTLVMQVDVANYDQVIEMVRRTSEEFGRIDIYVSNAAIAPHIPFLQLTKEQWERTLRVNLFGAFYGCQAAAKDMISKGVKGNIIIITSIAGMVGFSPPGPDYAATKAGLIALTRYMAIELAPHGIRVNAIAPGFILTDINRPVRDNPVLWEYWRKRIPLGRVGEPEEVGKLAVFLASENASYITGEIVTIDGGWVHSQY